jgi:polyisoprenoid-binding protein YceI
MKRLTFILLCCLSALTLSAQQQLHITRSKMTISGTSTMHDWTSNVNTVNGIATANMTDGKLQGLSAVKVDIDVYSIKSTKGSMMDNNTYNTLKAKKYPKISFALTRVNSIRQQGTEYAVNATGNLTLAGQTRAIDLQVTAKQLAGGGVEFRGTKSIKMSDFGIDPPTFMLGTLKVGDDIKIEFNVGFAPHNQ